MRTINYPDIVGDFCHDILDWLTSPQYPEHPVFSPSRGLCWNYYMWLDLFHNYDKIKYELLLQEAFLDGGLDWSWPFGAPHKSKKVYEHIPRLDWIHNNAVV